MNGGKKSIFWFFSVAKSITGFLLILFISVNALGQSASREFYELLKSNEDKSQAVFIGEAHAIEEYQLFEKELIVSLVENDSACYQIYLEFPFAANYIISEYLKAGNEQELQILSILVLSEKGYRYGSDFVLTLLKSVRELNKKGKKTEVFFTDILHTDKMAFALLKDRFEIAEENRFPVRYIDSLLTLDSIVFTTRQFDSVKQLLVLNEKIIAERFGVKNAEWARSIFASNYSHAGLDTVIRLRDRIFFEQISKTIDEKKKQLFIYGIAHVNKSGSSKSQKNVFDHLVQKGLITEKSCVRVILSSNKRDNVYFPDLNTGVYGLGNYQLSEMAYRIFSREIWPSKCNQDEDNVDYVILFKEIHSLTKKEKK